MITIDQIKAQKNRVDAYAWAAYRARTDDKIRAAEVLDALYDEAFSTLADMVGDHVREGLVRSGS